jgi:hypothetical protein
MRKIQNADGEKIPTPEQIQLNEAHELTSIFGSILSAGNSSIVSNFELLDFGFVSDFGFRISDFESSKTSCLQQRY